MTVLVRDLRPGDPADAAAFARVRHLALPFVLWTSEAVVHHLVRAQPGARSRSLVADGDNGPMLTAANGLGYGICGTEARHVRELG
ncbi:hypothetical protein ACVV2G_26425 [Streptomyces ziwulingensis]